MLLFPLWCAFCKHNHAEGLLRSQAESRLRDIGKAVDFGVVYDAATNAVYINSTQSYQDEERICSQLGRLIRLHGRSPKAASLHSVAQPEQWTPWR